MDPGDKHRDDTRYGLSFLDTATVATRYALRTTVTFACALLLHATPALAQSPEPRKAERVDDLLAQGYEIKAAIASPTGPRLILQKGSTIYNCDGHKLGTDMPATTPKRGVGVDRTLCFAVMFR